MVVGDFYRVTRCKAQHWPSVTLSNVLVRETKTIMVKVKTKG